MNNLISYTKSEKGQIDRELKTILKFAESGLSFWQILDEVFANENINKLIQNKNVDSMNQKLSAGTSVKKAPRVLLEVLTKSIKNDNYRFYTPSAGSPKARSAIAIRESISANLRRNLDSDDVVITTGSTGAISAVFEYVKYNFPDGEVIISSPTYYLYPFCAKYFGLNTKEVSAFNSSNGNLSTFVCTNEILKAINSKTKLICLVNPTNPSGEYYTTNDLERILLKAKKYDCLVLVDELFGFLDYQGNRNRFPSLKASETVKAENNLVVINGYSKALNLAGIRIGYLLTKNTALRKGVIRINEVRNCFPVGYQYDELIEVDSLFRIIDLLAGQNGNLRLAIEKACRLVSINIPKQKISDYYNSYWTSINTTVSEYQKQLEYATGYLCEVTEKSIVPASGFNSFVKINMSENINQLDFAINCFLATGVKIQIGPCFGLKQKDWEENYGVWLRLTTARETSVYQKALISVRTFISEYSRGWSVIKANYQIL